MDLNPERLLSQLKILDSWIIKRNKIAKVYKQLIKSKNIFFQKKLKDVVSSYHLFVILVKSNKVNRDKIYKYLQKKKIHTNVHYIPIYRHPYYKKIGYLTKNFKNCEKYYKETLTLPIYPSLKKSSQS